MAIYERIDLLDSELQLLASQVKGDSLAVPGDVVKSHFRAVILFGESGKSGTQWGDRLPLPSLTDQEKRHIMAGRSVLKTRPCDEESGTCVSLIRAVDPQRSEFAILAADLNPEFLWPRQSLPTGLEFCAFTPSKTLLHCSDGTSNVGAGDSVAFNHSSGIFQWQSDENLYDAAYWRLLLKPVYLEPFWTVVVSEKHDGVLGPMQHFRNTFPLIVLLSLWFVLLFSLIQIRRTLGPLQELREATLAVAAGRFDTRVRIHSQDEFEELGDSFNSMSLRLGRQFHTLTTIHEIDQAIFASLDRDAIIDALLAHMSNLVAADAYAVSLFNPSALTASIRIRHASSVVLETRSVQFDPSDLLQFQNNAETVVIQGQQAPGFLIPLSAGGMQSFLILPIRVDNSISAALVCAQKGALSISSDEAHDARQVADQLTIALSNVQLMDAMEQLHWGTLTALARAIDAKSQWTAGHSERVTNLSLEIGRVMRLTGKELRIIHLGGLLHDVGKIGTPPSILDKPGKLDPEETRIMRDHVRIGMRILEPIAAFREAMLVVSQHHEQYDGSGYPEGLAGEQISIYGRIFAVADCYDAMTSDRPYRKGLPKEQTLNVIKAGAGKQFDPKVVDVFLELCKQKEAQTALAAQAGRL